jgi:hypothetical protein
MITIEEWMQDTSVFAYPRSPEMKAIDEAIRNFKEQSPSSRKAIETALENWKAKEKKSGQDWKQSRRNKNGTIEKLDLELRHVIRARTPEELVAMWEVRRGNEQNLKTLFSGKQLVVKNSKAASGAGTIASAASSVEKSLKSGMSAVKAAASGASPTDIVNNLCGGSSSVLGTSGHAVLSAFSKAMPLLNVIKGGVTVSAKLVSIAKSGWMKYRTAEQARSAFAPGDPAAALDALQQMIGREMRESAFDAASEALKLGADITALVASGGIAAPVTSFVTDFARNIGQLCYTVYLFSRDQSEANIANKYLINGPWDLSLFKYSPLLGCYVLACSTTSAVIAMSVHQYGKPGWLVETEVMKRKADPLIDKAGELIRAGRYEIPELSHFKGVVPPSINKWSNLFLAKASSFKYELETSKDEGAKFKPQVPTKGQLPADFKSRITGEHPKA